VNNPSINAKPEVGALGINGAFEISDEFLVKIPTVGPEKG